MVMLNEELQILRLYSRHIHIQLFQTDKQFLYLIILQNTIDKG